ncbi:hypothetical protein ACFWTE_26605 [Nocardiopsis sp. NPDC058631]|uniref:hypothetical protein n=1 Tax=Nocardiopsis sp. NPDC058631 TaxID=3346566 RepID=UPI00364E7DEA
MTYRGHGHRGVRRTVAVAVYLTTGALTVAAIAVVVRCGIAAVQGVWELALTRM